MKYILFGILGAAMLAGCTNNGQSAASTRPSQTVDETPSNGISISGYARFGVEKGP